MSNNHTPIRRSYGNWILQRSPGIPGFGLLGSVLLFIAVISALFALMFAGPTPALVILGIFAILIGFTTPLGKALTHQIRFSLHTVENEHHFRSGVFSKNKNPELRLPGAIGKMRLHDRIDPMGNRFAVLENPHNGGYFTVVARCISDGPALQPQDRLDHWVGQYGFMLSSMGAEPALVCGKAIIDTAPDHGGRLKTHVRSSRAAGAPALATAVMEECLATYPATDSENVTYIELTFKGRLLSRRNKFEDIMSELSRKVPTIIGQAQAAGGGSVEMLTPSQLPQIVRAAYDPDAQRYLEEAEMKGIENPVDWHDAGPVASHDLWASFRHDSGLSVTYEMVSPPRSAIRELALSGISRPHNDFVRKRVALIYRPHSPDDSASVAERDAQTATFLASGTKKKVSAANQRIMRATEQTRQEVAAGSALVRFSVLITATVASEEDLPQAEATILTQSGSIPFRIRKSFGSQAAAFATTLPVGFVPWEHSAIPSKIREIL